MTHDIFIQLCQGTEEDFAIACYWLCTNHDPIEYIETHGTKLIGSPNCTRSISWDDEWQGEYRIRTCIYYKYQEFCYIVKCYHGVTVTNRNYDHTAKVIKH